MFMKKKMILLLITLGLLTGCGYDKYEMPKDAYINLNDNNYLVFDEIKMGDLVKDTNVEILNKDEQVVNDKTGNHTVTLDYKFKKRTYKFDITYELIDNESPFILSASASKTVVKDSEFDPCEGTNFIDNYDREPKCRIEGEYDLSKTGNYAVQYIFSDESNNETTRTLTIKVVESVKKPTTTTTKKPATTNPNPVVPKYNIQEYINKYKFDDTMIGIDVSRWQGDIDYTQVKEAGVEFVIMRMGVQSGSKKDLEMDSFYKKNIENAKNAGLKVGVYLYSVALNQDKAREHAKWVVKNLNGMKLDFPIAYDWENWQYIREYNVSIHDLNMNFEAFADELNKNGYDTMLYSSKYYLNHIWNNKKDYPVWQAHYADQTEMDKNGIMWQFSDKGKVPGITGNVDLDIYYLD